MSKELEVKLSELSDKLQERYNRSKKSEIPAPDHWLYGFEAAQRIVTDWLLEMRGYDVHKIEIEGVRKIRDMIDEQKNKDNNE